MRERERQTVRQSLSLMFCFFVVLLIGFEGGKKGRRKGICLSVVAFLFLLQLTHVFISASVHLFVCLSVCGTDRRLD